MILPEPLTEYGECVVYAAINSVNGKLYIGATERGIAMRRARHFSRARKGENGYFAAAIRKYGEESFHFFPVVECQSFFHALDMERELILSLRPEYNLTFGGGGVHGLTFTDESKRRMSESAKRRKSRYVFTEEDQRKSIIASRNRAGIKITNKERLIAVLNAARMANESKKRKVISSDGISFNSVSDASKFYGKTTGQISRCCKLNTKFKSGLALRYAEDSHP